MTVYVYSTLSAPTAYTLYEPITESNKMLQKDLPIFKLDKHGNPHKILIKGGANVAHASGDSAMYTPKGVATAVSDEDYELLKDDVHFKQHIKNGFITVEEKEYDAGKVASNLKEKDASAPRTPDDPEFDEKRGGVKVAENSKGKGK